MGYRNILHRVATIDEVDVWSADIDAPLDVAELLSPDETQRANNTGSPDVRRRFIARRGLLRVLLADYLGEPPGSIPLQAGTHGKPALAGEQRVRFSVSSSAGQALYAVSRAFEVGVDIQRIDQARSIGLIIEHHYTARERVLVRSAPEGDRDELFITLWTRKEACAKALGVGLSRSLSDYDVSGAVQPIRVDADGQTILVYDVSAPAGYRAALAIVREAVAPR
jgi:4'-phosphopantetheinyl transferase